jgi:Uma2 family endonuclease
MVVTTLEELVANRAKLMPLTVEQYHRMLETGILRDGDPYELLDGYLVRKDRSEAGADPMTIGPDHSGGVKLLGELNDQLKPLGYHIALQQPVSILPDSEPEPDGAILRGSIRDYAGRHPDPADIACLFEVADSSLQHDRKTKLRIYADCGIPQCVIVNLVDNVVEVYTNPVRGQGRYHVVQVLRPGEKLRIALAGGSYLDVAVEALLP